MKKLLTTTILALSLATTAVADQQTIKQVDHKWSVKLGGYTTNDNMTNQWNDLKIATKLGVTYNINKNFYLQGTGVMSDRSHYLFQPLLGFQVNVAKRLTTYAEVSGTFYSYKGSDNRAFDYDAGFKFDIYKGLYVGAETGDIFEADYGYYSLKVGVPVAKNLVFSASYDLKYKGHYNGVSASIEYLI